MFLPQEAVHVGRAWRRSRNRGEEGTRAARRRAQASHSPSESRPRLPVGCSPPPSLSPTRVQERWRRQPGWRGGGTFSTVPQAQSPFRTPGILPLAQPPERHMTRPPTAKRSGSESCTAHAIKFSVICGGGGGGGGWGRPGGRARRGSGGKYPPSRGGRAASAPTEPRTLVRVKDSRTRIETQGLGLSAQKGHSIRGLRASGVVRVELIFWKFGEA